MSSAFYHKMKKNKSWLKRQRAMQKAWRERDKKKPEVLDLSEELALPLGEGDKWIKVKSKF